MPVTEKFNDANMREAVLNSIGTYFTEDNGKAARPSCDKEDMCWHLLNVSVY